MRARALTSCVAPALARGLGGVALTAALLVPAGTALATTDDDPPATRTEEIGVDIPDRSGGPTTPTPTPTSTPTATPTPTSTAAPAHGGASGGLPDTGIDLSALWPLAVSALGLTAAGTVVLVSRRRRHARD
ncbi:LPXTG cell wall anchor domain-containing protein [Herbiconiux sp. CPCC 205763]|uniref:LPXTG cell wall anchor domain-containing protein n=1 Tax=Herbiconiux aconitum TaxID=2970913 RepID=A0ABT2GUA0_9MICO|nr:LPXTG cell wall anchor domain-containing protein [Herbiconiux aconitum]MCS5718456.1 LPXTG cell wall anchor domain-containing protein [Herbiconiux aconitum]